MTQAFSGCKSPTNSKNPRDGLGAFENLHSKTTVLSPRCITKSISAPLPVRINDGRQRGSAAISCSSTKPSHEAPTMGCPSNWSYRSISSNACKMPLSLTYTLGELIKRFCGSVNPDRPLTGLLDIDGPVLIYRIDEDQGLQRRGNVPRFALTQILPFSANIHAIC